jgi:hypothetical protein
MFDMLRRLAVLIIILAIVGVWRGWFHFSQNPPTNNDQTSINVTVDQTKVKADAAKVKQEIREKVIPKVKELVNDAKAPPPPASNR